MGVQALQTAANYKISIGSKVCFVCSSCLEKGCFPFFLRRVAVFLTLSCFPFFLVLVVFFLFLLFFYK